MVRKPRNDPQQVAVAKPSFVKVMKPLLMIWSREGWGEQHVYISPAALAGFLQGRFPMSGLG